MLTYFDGIDFVTAGNFPAHNWMIGGKRFADYYGIQYNHAGNLHLAIDGGEEKIYSGAHVFLTMPGRVYTYGCTAPETRHHVFLCFKGPRVEKFIAGGLFDPAAELPVFPVADPEKFFRTMLEIQALLPHPLPHEKARAVQLLESLLLQLHAQTPEPKINLFYGEKLQKLRDGIIAAPQNAWNFDAEARKAGISIPHFRRLFQEILRDAPTHFLIECRLKLAETLLVGTALPVAEIAHRCGYADESYFYRLFKKHRNMTMLGYRKEFKL